MLRILLLTIMYSFFIICLSYFLIIPWVIFESWVGISFAYFIEYTIFCFTLWISMGGEITFLQVLAAPLIIIYDCLLNK